MPTYVCELCKKEFSQKGDLTKHKAKKTPCITMSQINELSQATTSVTDTKQKMKSMFKKILDILRNEGITGEKALKNMASLLILKMLENKIGKEIDMDNYVYPFEKVCPEKKKKLLLLLHFTNLLKQEDTDIERNMNELWRLILCEHPSTEKVFQRGNTFDIKHPTTYKKIFKELIESDMNIDDSDTLGDAYEEVIQDIMTGKVLGQFFTPPKVKKLMIHLIKPKIFDDGTVETCCDPTMGTGGFLLNYIKSISTQSKEKNIVLNWEFIKTALYGKEISPDTYNLAMANMLISTGHIFDLDNGDSIRAPIDRKFDIVLANPPFGIKGLKYDDFIPQVKEILPIKSDNAVSLFIQKIIHILNIGGRCAVVLPDGQDLFSKSATYVAVREYLMKSCDLKEIIYMPAGIFDYTSIKTCVFYFVKKRDNVIKEIKKKGYTFAKTLQTKSVKFYDFNSEKEEKHLLIDVPIQDIVSNSYSLNYAEYMKEEEEEYEEGIVVKTLGEVCDIDKNIKKHPTNYGNPNGKYKFHTGGVRTDLYVDEYDIEELYIIQNRTNGSGKCNLFLDKKFTLAQQTMVYISKNKNEITTKYIYYYLYHNIDLLENGFIGSGHKNISHEYLSQIKIPIPSLDRQQEIVTYLDFIEKTNKTSQEKINDLKMLNEYCLKNQKMFGENEVKNLGDISLINPENMKSGEYTQINYIDIASVKGGQILELQSLTKDFPSRAKRIIKQNDILYSSVRPNLRGYVYIQDNIQNAIASTGFAQIRIKKTDGILPKYVYYIMTSDYITDELISKAKGAQYPAVSFDDFENIKIPIPTLERQQEIVEYCEYNDKLIQQLEKEMDNNKLQAKQCIQSILKLKDSL